MPTPLDPHSAVALLQETETRMVQALSNFFQRNRIKIHDVLLRDMAEQTTPSMLATRQTCLDWINADPEALSTAFAEQFRQLLARPETFEQHTSSPSAQLQLVDDDVLERQLAEEKVAAHLTDSLRPELLLLFGRLQSLTHHTKDQHEQARGFGPKAVTHALSRALDTLNLASPSGTLFIQSTADPLCETLKHTYTALNQFLSEQGVDDPTPVRTLHAPEPHRTESAIGHDVLAHIEFLAANRQSSQPTAGVEPASLVAAWGGDLAAGGLPNFLDTLANWQTQAPPIAGTAASAQLLRQLQQDTHHTDAGRFDLEVLDALTTWFDFILGDPDVSPRYQSVIAQLQIPTLRVALESTAFFNDDHHPARQLIDLLGQFSRRFPDAHPACINALQQAEAACANLSSDDLLPAEGFAQAQHALDSWLSGENARVETGFSAEIAHLQHIEKQALGTLLARQNLQDLAARLPAPEAVLQRLEAAWIPYMSSLYVAESGEGAHWRDACSILLQLFQSLQAPAPDAREARLRSIPVINTALRHGLLAQSADPAQLKNFFGAITTAQECWIRPDVSQPAGALSTIEPQPVSVDDAETLARQLAAPSADDPLLQQVQQLHAGQWVDFDPPCQGLTSARVVWAGFHGHWLFCDATETQHFSLDCSQLAADIRAERARIPEQSLTRRAMLRLKSHLSANAA